MVLSIAINPNNMEAQARRKLRLSCQLQQPRRIPPPPSKGRSTGYPSWHRQDQLQKIQNNEEVKVSQATIYRWFERAESFRQTVNHERSTLVRFDLLNLVIFIIAQPDTSIDEIAAFIYNEGGSLYSNQRISQRLKELQLTKKSLYRSIPGHGPAKSLSREGFLE